MTPNIKDIPKQKLDTALVRLCALYDGAIGHPSQEDLEIAIAAIVAFQNDNKVASNEALLKLLGDSSAYAIHFFHVMCQLIESDGLTFIEREFVDKVRGRVDEKMKPGVYLEEGSQSSSGQRVKVYDVEGREHTGTIMSEYATPKGKWYQVSVDGTGLVNLPESHVKEIA